MASNISNNHKEPVIAIAIPINQNESPPSSSPKRQTKHKKKKREKTRRQQQPQRWRLVLWAVCGIMAALWLAFSEDSKDISDFPSNEKDSWILPSMPPLIDLPDQRSLEELKQEYKGLKFDIPFIGNKESGDIQFQVNRTALLEFLHARDKTKRKLLAAAKREQQGTKAPRQELQGIASESPPLALSFEKGYE